MGCTALHLYIQHLYYLKSPLVKVNSMRVCIYQQTDLKFSSFTSTPYLVEAHGQLGKYPVLLTHTTASGKVSRPVLKT